MVHCAIAERLWEAIDALGGWATKPTRRNSHAIVGGLRRSESLINEVVVRAANGKRSKKPEDYRNITLKLLENWMISWSKSLPPRKQRAGKPLRI